MEKVEQPASIYLLELVLVLASGAVGLIRLFREGSPTVVSILVMLALPVAAALVAGALGRASIQGRTRPHWSVILALPLMHAATIFAFAKLIEEANTGIQAPERIASSLLWADPSMLLFSSGAQAIAIFALLKLYWRRKCPL